MAIFFFARVIRAAIVGSVTRNARAMSGTGSPQTSRRVSADLGFLREGRVAADEDQPQPLVRHRLAELSTSRSSG